MNYHQYLKDHPMNRYEEYTERDIESLVEETVRMDAEISRLWDINCDLVEACKQALLDKEQTELHSDTRTMLWAAIAKAEDSGYQL